MIDQWPAGDTRHLVWGKGAAPDSAYTLLNEFDRYTVSGDILSYSPEAPWEDIRYVKIETTESPSWVSWREIEVVHNVTWPVNRDEPWGTDRAPVSFSPGP